MLLFNIACKKKQPAEKPIVYVDRVSNLMAFAGENRVKLTWKTSDNIYKCRVSWNAGKSLMEIPMVKGETNYTFFINDLPEDDHIFSLVAFDQNENASEKVEIKSASYGNNYQKSLHNRTIKSLFYNENEKATIINWDQSKAGELNSEIKYTNDKGIQTISNVSPITETSKLNEIQAGDSITLRTAYLPQTDAIDTFFSSQEVIKIPLNEDETGYSLVTLNADGPGNTYELLGQVWGGSPEETPDCAHPSFGRHIAEEFDMQLQKNVFSFFAHVTPDNDRCGATDRQRTEIKTYGSSPGAVKAFKGDEMLFKWKFKLATGFQPSSSFTHIHQIKAGDGDNAGSPLMTLTPRYSSGGDKLEVIHTGDNSSSNQGKVKIVDLEQIKGEWIQVVEKIKFDTHGSYQLTISKVSNGEVVLNYVNNNIDFWRSGATFIRPKWGIYRSLNDADRLRDEKVLFSDIIIGKK